MNGTIYRGWINNENTISDSFWYHFFYCSPPVKLPSNSFWGNWVLEMVINLLYFSFLWSFLTNRLRVLRSRSDSFHFLPEFCFSVEVFPFFSNVIITFVTVLPVIPNNSTVFVKLAPAIQAPKTWLLLKSDRSAILMNLDLFLLVIS